MFPQLGHLAVELRVIKEGIALLLVACSNCATLEGCGEETLHSRVWAEGPQGLAPMRFPASSVCSAMKTKSSVAAPEYEVSQGPVV